MVILRIIASKYFRFLTSAKENFGINEASEFLIRTMLENDEVTVLRSVKNMNGTKAVPANSTIHLGKQEPQINQQGGCC
jgi:hypothetical protein